jgi:hypothetical protein
MGLLIGAAPQLVIRQKHGNDELTLAPFDALY